jgi:hypothetical protein
MPRSKKQVLDELSPRERTVVGDADAYDWDAATRLPARERPAVTQFSLRVDKALFEDLQTLARERGVTLSDVAREALERFVRAGGRPAITNVQVSFPSDSGLLVQVAGTRAELSPSRRAASPDERVTAVVGSPSPF